MISVPASRICFGDNPLMAAFVPQKIKFGVSIVPCGVSSRPSLARVCGSL
jgi:hypothetical protein